MRIRTGPAGKRGLRTYAGRATQKHGRNLDRHLIRVRVPVRRAEGVVLPGTDQVGVQIKLDAVSMDTLGTRQELQTTMPADVLDMAVGADWEGRLGISLGEIPAT